MKLSTPQNPASGSVVNTASLAERLGLSRWTVSRVLNDQPGVKEETRKRVLAAVEASGFKPNLQARRLRGLPTKLVGISFQELEAPVLALKSSEIQKQLKERGYRGLFELAGGDPSVERDVIQHFISIGVDGIVLMGSKLQEEDEIFVRLNEQGIAIVTADAREGLSVPKVEVDRANAMEQVVEHLYGYGHRKFGLLGIGSDDMYLQRRVSGLKRAIKKRGLSWESDVIEISMQGRDIQSPYYGQDLAKELLKKDTLPTALISLNDRISMGVSKTLKEAGIKIPEDVSIIGFDNLEECNWLTPALSSVDQNVGDLMKASADILLKVMERKKVPSITKIQPILNPRKSTATFKK